MTATEPVLGDGPRGRGYWWFLLSCLGIALLAVVPYLTASLESLAGGGSRLAVNYADRPAPVRVAFYLHVVLGGTALLLSPLQFAARLRRRRPRVHRATGRAVLGSIAVAGTAGFVLSWYNLAGPVGTAGFGTLAVLWVAFAAAAFRTARRRDIAAHRRWAVRTFALTYAAVTLRLWLLLLIPLETSLLGTDADAAWDRAYAVVPFLCWVPNLVVAERHLRSRRHRAPEPAYPGA